MWKTLPEPCHTPQLFLEGKDTVCLRALLYLTFVRMSTTLSHIFENHLISQKGELDFMNYDKLEALVKEKGVSKTFLCQIVGRERYYMRDCKLRETESSLNNIMKAIEKGIFNDTTAARMQQLEDDKKDLKNLIADAEIEQPMLTKDQVSFFLHKMKKGDPNSIEFQERIIDIFITAIYLYDDNMLKIVYTYNHESQDYELPSDSTENENEAESLAYNGKCSTSSMLVESSAQNANTTLEITTRYIILTSYLHSAFSVL